MITVDKYPVIATFVESHVWNPWSSIEIWRCSQKQNDGAIKRWYGLYNDGDWETDVKTIKESGFVSYVTLNKNFTDTARTYLEKSELPAGIVELKADDSVSAEKVKLFVYSNMSEPDPDLHFEFTVYRDPASSPFQYMDVQYYDSKNKLLRSGYSVPSINSTYTLTLTKVE